jgi:hypothetical protein
MVGEEEMVNPVVEERSINVIRPPAQWHRMISAAAGNASEVSEWS